MTIHLRVICQEVFGKLPNGDYTVPDGSDARSALRACVAQYQGNDILMDCIDHVVYMCNEKHISPETVLSDGDRLMVLRPVHGG